MLNQNEKFDRFAEVINKTAYNQCKKIEKQTEKYKAEEISKLEKQAQSELDSKLKYALERIKADTSKLIAEANAKSRKELVLKRDGIMKEVFEKAEKKLSEFTKTSAYDEFISKSLADINENLDGKFSLSVRECDVEKVKKLCEKYDRVIGVTSSDEISIGGIIAESDDKTLTINDTLEEKLYGQREQFMAVSGLSIN